jgi:hypothetical protein
VVREVVAQVERLEEGVGAVVVVVAGEVVAVEVVAVEAAVEGDEMDEIVGRNVRRAPSVLVQTKLNDGQIIFNRKDAIT